MKGREMSKKMRGSLWVTGFLGLLASLFSYASPIHADDTDLFTISVRPNVLIVLDNSNSMDEDFYGNGVGSFSSSSRSVVGKNVLNGLINTYINSMRVGLMTYRLPGSSKWYLHNSAYFSSYDPKSYCPNPPNECVDYCQTGNSTSQSICQSTCGSQNSLFDATYFDEIIPASTLGSQKRNTYCNLIYPKTNRVPNPTDPSNYIYYNRLSPSTIRPMTEPYSSIRLDTARMNIPLLIIATTCIPGKLGLRIRKLGIQIIILRGGSLPQTPIMPWDMPTLGGGCFLIMPGEPGLPMGPRVMDICMYRPTIITMPTTPS